MTSRGEGSWLVMMKLPDMKSRLMARCRTRGEAEHTKERLMRLTGNRFPLVVMFEAPDEAETIEQELTKLTHRYS
jgi:hypothetical protein